MPAEVVVSHDNSQLQSSPPPKVTPAQIHRAARFIEIKFHRDANIRRELLEALGLAPTTTPTGGTR